MSEFGTASELPPRAPRATPGCRAARPGSGGGGINCASVRMVGMPVLLDELARCALFRLGNAGAMSESSRSVSVSSPSSASSGGGEALVSVGTDEAGCTKDVPDDSQLRRYEVMVFEQIAIETGMRRNHKAKI